MIGVDVNAIISQKIENNLSNYRKIGCWRGTGKKRNLLLRGKEIAQEFGFR
jgi:ribosomal protein S13